MNNIKNNDICFLIPSYNRYDKLINLLNQIFKYEGVNVIVYNDKSDDDRYKKLDYQYTNLKVLHGLENNGKVKFNYTIKSLINEAKLSDFEYFIFIADDMVLCKNFLPNTIPLLNRYDIVNLFSLSSGGWGCTSYIDGVFTISKSAIELIYDIIPTKLKNIENKSTGVWETVTRYFCSENTSNYRLTSLNYALVQHDGNFDSKLHPKFRLKIPIIASNFYDDYYGNEITLISYSKNNKIIKSNNNNKKSVTSGGSMIQRIAEPIIESKPIPQNKPEIKSQISSKPQKLFNPEIELKPKPEAKKKQTISENKAIFKPIVESKPIEPIVESKPIEPIVESKPIEPIIESKPIEPIIESKPIEPIIESKPIVKPTEPEIKSPIKSKTSDNKSKSSISKIPNDLDISRLRKQRLNFGKR